MKPLSSYRGFAALPARQPGCFARQAQGIAAYEGLRRLAKSLERDDAVALLDENLKQEKEALRTVEKIVTRVSNEAVSQAVTSSA